MAERERFDVEQKGQLAFYADLRQQSLDWERRTFQLTDSRGRSLHVTLLSMSSSLTHLDAGRCAQSDRL
eukprot:848207-Rhodomonas_salina.1